MREGLKRPPRHALGYKRGLPLAYLIDFLEPDGSVAFRVYYQDTATSAPVGFPPALPAADAHPIDVAILCVASFSEVERHPEEIVRAADPRLVVLGHWEDFFVPPGELRPVRGTDLEAFLERLEPVVPGTADAVLPEPGAELRIESCARSGGGPGP